MPFDFPNNEYQKCIFFVLDSIAVDQKSLDFSIDPIHSNSPTSPTRKCFIINYFNAYPMHPKALRSSVIQWIEYPAPFRVSLSSIRMPVWGRPTAQFSPTTFPRRTKARLYYLYILFFFVGPEWNLRWLTLCAMVPSSVISNHRPFTADKTIHCLFGRTVVIRNGRVFFFFLVRYSYLFFASEYKS